MYMKIKYKLQFMKINFGQIVQYSQIPSLGEIQSSSNEFE